MKHLLVVLMLSPVLAMAQNVSLSGSQTVVTFDIDDVENGTVSGIEIESELNLDDPSSSWIKASADASTLNTGLADRDKHIKHDANGYLDVEKTPIFTFESDNIVKTESGYMAYGKLTIGGITHEAKMPFVQKDDKLIGRIKIHTGSYGIHDDEPSDSDAYNCIIRIESVIQ